MYAPMGNSVSRCCCPWCSSRSNFRNTNHNRARLNQLDKLQFYAEETKKACQLSAGFSFSRIGWKSKPAYFWHVIFPIKRQVSTLIDFTLAARASEKANDNSILTLTSLLPHNTNLGINLWLHVFLWSKRRLFVSTSRIQGISVPNSRKQAVETVLWR